MADDIITLMVLEGEGREYGVNGWAANARDRHLYEEQGDGGTDEQEA